MFESIYEKSLLLFNRSNCNHVKLADMIYLCYLGGTETKDGLSKGILCLQTRYTVRSKTYAREPTFETSSNF